MKFCPPLFNPLALLKNKSWIPHIECRNSLCFRWCCQNDERLNNLWFFPAAFSKLQHLPVSTPLHFFTPCTPPQAPHVVVLGCLTPQQLRVWPGACFSIVGHTGGSSQGSASWIFRKRPNACFASLIWFSVLQFLRVVFLLRSFFFGWFFLLLWTVSFLLLVVASFSSSLN